MAELVFVACCDGRHRSTYCPDCGKKLREPSVDDEIIGHMTLTIKKNRGALRARREQIDEPGANKTKVSRQIASLEAQIEKWERWRSRLRELREIAKGNAPNE